MNDMNILAMNLAKFVYDRAQKQTGLPELKWDECVHRDDYSPDHFKQQGDYPNDEGMQEGY